MFRIKLLCGGAIACMLLSGLGAVRAEAAETLCVRDTGTQVVNMQSVEETNIDDIDDSDEGSSETAIDGSNYGRINRRTLKKNPDINVEVNYGVDGYATYDAGSQIVLTVDSDIPFSGKVSIIPSYDEYYGDQKMEYSQKVSWEAGDRTQLKFYVDSLGYGRMLVQLSDDSGDVIYSESDQLSVNGYEMISVMGILSDDPDKFSNLDEARIRYQMDKVNITRLNMTGDLFPESIQGLDVVHYILIDDYDTSQLSDAQMAAIQEWVLEGGTLILSLGDAAGKVLSGFESDFIRCRLDSVASTDIDIKLENGRVLSYDSVPEAKLSVDGMDPYEALAGAYVVDSGYGRIIVLPYSIGSQPIHGGDGELQLDEQILKAGYTTKIRAMVQGSYYNDTESIGITNAMNANDKKTVPPVVLIVILVIYLIVCGPLTYLLLKRMKRRELIWIAVPAWAVIGTLAIYIISKSYRVTKPLELSFVSADISDNVMKQNVYTYIMGAKAGHYSVDVDNAYRNVRVLDGYYGNSSSTQASTDVERMTENDGVNVSFDTHIPFGSVSLAASSVTSNDIGTFDSGIKLYTDGIEGSVVNNTAYDMKDVVVMSDGYYYCIDSLAAGAFLNITKAQNRKMIRGMSIDCMKSYYVYRYGTDYNYDDDASAMMYRNYYMMLMMSAYSPVASGEGRVAIWATIDRDTDVLGGGNAEKYGSYVVYDVRAQKYEDVDGAYYSNIYTRDVNRNVQSDYDTNDMMIYSDQIDIDVQFRSHDDITSLTNETDSKDTSSSNVVVKAYNYSTGNYDVIFSNGATEIKGDRLRKYLQNGEIKLRFISPHQGSEYTEVYLPRISARGGGD